MTALLARSHEIRAMLAGGEFVVIRPLKVQPQPCGGKIIGAIYANDMYWPISRPGEAYAGVVSCKPHPPQAYLDAFPLPYSPGDLVCVKEAWARANDPEWLVAYRADGRCGAWGWDGDGGRNFTPHGYVLDQVRRDNRGDFGLPRYGGRWRPSTHMPQWASRLSLSVRGVAVKRAQDVTEEEARQALEVDEETGCWLGPDRKGAAPGKPSLYVSAYGALRRVWDQQNRAYPWDSNPWIVAAKCAVHHKNIKDENSSRGVLAGAGAA